MFKLIAKGMAFGASVLAGQLLLIAAMDKIEHSYNARKRNKRAKAKVVDIHSKEPVE